MRGYSNDVGLHALLLQQQQDAPPALLSEWIAARGLDVTVVRADLAAELPEPARFDLAVVLGSDESAGDRSLRWVALELDWLRGAAARGLPVLGICFGAQALAVALGGRVRRAERPEIGWVSVDTDAPELVGSGPWFTWHHDVIELPDAATEIARNDACTQAFVAGAHLGVQFHPEVTVAVVEAWADAGGGARQLAAFAETRERLMAESWRRQAAARDSAFALFDAFLARARPSRLRISAKPDSL